MGHGGDEVERENVTLSPRPRVPASVLVLGLGNPILGDDGVGWRVVELAEQRWRAELHAQEAEFDCLATGGISLMERLIGYRRAILVDTIQTPGGLPGAFYRLAMDDLPTRHADGAHDASLKAALELGRRLGAELPSEITVYAIEAAEVYNFGESLSPQVAAVVPTVAGVLLENL